MLPYNVIKISLYYGYISTIVVGGQFHCRGYTKNSISTSTSELKIHCITWIHKKNKVIQ